ncbi:MAG: Hsp20/alpha crystallin family protein [Pseudobdellovibrionaceae bacterium]
MHQSVQQLPVTNENSIARFAMNRLEFGVSEQSNHPLSAPPYELSEEDGAFNIYFNMHGIPESGIRLGLDLESQRFTVFAEREKPNFTDQFLWVFSLPANVDLGLVQTYYKKGVVQFNFPRRLAA